MSWLRLPRSFRLRPRSEARRARRQRISVLLAAVLTAATLATGLATPAVAAGDGVLDLKITAVDSATGDPLTSLEYGQHQDKVAYRVEFACSVSTCEDTEVQLAPSPADPFGLAAVGPTAAGTNNAAAGRSILTYESFTKPAGMDQTTISGDDATGKVVTLGDLQPGAAGSFLVVYTTTPSAILNTAVSPSQFYPDGFQIKMSATIDSPSATGPRSDDADDVTWHIQTPDPGVAMNGIGTVKPGVDVSHQVRMGSGAIRGTVDNISASGGNVRGFSKWIAAGNFTTVVELDPRAVYVSDNAGGVYDAGTHTVTWTRGTPADPAYWAAGGWGSVSGNNWNSRGQYFKPNLVLSYPAANFPAADADGCNFSETVTNTIRTSVTYLDEVAVAARTTKTAEAQATTTVACYTPFGRVGIVKNATGVTGTSPRVQYVPESGEPAVNHYWSVLARNGGNRAGVGVITDNTLDQADAHVHRIQAMTAGGTIVYELNDGTTGTATTTVVDAPEGKWFVKATVTTAPIAPVNVVPTGTSWADSEVRFHYRLASDAPVGQTRTNTASVSMTYPDEPELAGDVLTAGPVSASVIFAKPTAGFGARFDGPAMVSGGGNAVPGSDVTFKVRGATRNLPADRHITPQYVFVAPVGWEIQDGSASFAPGSVPAGVSFDYATKSIDGADRQVVVASWPDTVEFGRDTTWPSMSVIASPTALVAAGTNSVANAWIADSRNNWDNTTADFAWESTARADGSDVDSDLVLDEWFATTSQTVAVSAADRLLVLKEVCVPDSEQVDGCDWQSNPDEPVYVAPGSSDLKYRVTVENGGNTVLDEVVAYDVLPHLGDTGISSGTAGTPRGSDFSVTINEVSDVASGLALAYSASTNPERPQVFPGATGTTNDWSAAAAGKTAIRASVAGTMQPGDEKAFSFTVAIDPAAEVGDQACNSVAADSNKTLPAEPRAVCVQVAEADLAIDTNTPPPLQVGRPGFMTFDVTNHGPSDNAPSVVQLQIPSGVTLTDLNPAGWACEDVVGQPAPISGPVTLTCAAVDDVGDPRALGLDDPEELRIAMTPTALVAQLCVDASIAGPMHDPVLGNNATQACAAVSAATAGVSISKDDGRDSVRRGETYTYTVTVANTLVGEDLSNVIVTDALPDGLVFVSATGDADVDGQLVTWGPIGLAAGSDTELRVTVRVADDVDESIVNTASVEAPDPAGTPGLLTGSDTDTDLVRALSVSKSSDAGADPQPGDVVTYTIEVTNQGPDDYTAAQPATVSDDLSEILDDGALTGDPEASIGSEPVVDADTGELTWSGALVAGQSVEITYAVTLGAGGDGSVVNTACVPASDAVIGAERCDTVGFELPKLTVTKIASTDALPSVGDTVTYTVTVSNDSEADFTSAHPATMTDDLSDVLDDASLDADEDVSASAGTVDFASPTLSWSGVLESGDSVTITYTVTYTGEGDRIVTNQACIPAAYTSQGSLSCATTQALGAALDVSKSVSPASGTSVHPGDTLTYTIDLASTGRTAATVALVDDLSGVLDDADVTVAASSSHPAVTAGLVGGTLLIAGSLPDGETASITYSVEVKPVAEQDDHVLDNFVGTVPAGGVCLPTNDLCTTNPVAFLTVDKSNDASAHAAHGDTITYRVVVTSAGPGSFTSADPAEVHDDLSAVLDDATVSGVPTTERGDDPTELDGTISWSGPLASGETNTIGYTVVADKVGDYTLTNSACVTNGTDDPTCSTVTTPLARIIVDKTSDPDSGGEVRVGDDIDYTLLFRNVGTGPGLVDHADHLGDVIDDADLTAGPDSSSSDLIAELLSSDTIAVTGEVAAGMEEQVTYTARVKRGGNGEVANYLVPNGIAPPAACVAGDDPSGLSACTVSTVLDPDGADGDGLLPDTGGPANPWVILGALVAIVAGMMLLKRRPVEQA